MKTRILFTILVSLLWMLCLNNMILAEYFVYNMDGSHIETETIDSLIAVRFDPDASVNSVNFAYSKEYLQDEIEFEFLSGRFTVFEIEAGWDFESVAEQLR